MSGLQIFLSLFAALFSWRLYRFTIQPILYPNDPKQLPYWLPFIGHLIPFFQNFNNAISSGRKNFHPSSEPFVMTVAGQTIYVATSAEDINAVWKNSKTISLNPIVSDMYVGVGIGEKSKEALFRVHEDAEYNKGKGRGMTPTQMVIELHHQQLHKGARLDELMECTVASMLRQLDFSSTGEAVRNRETASIISLHQLCVDIFMTGVTTVYFGPKLLAIEPNLIKAFESWEHCNWKFLFQLPTVFSGDLLAAQTTLTVAFTRYYQLPKSERPGAIFFVDALEDTLRGAGLSEEEMGQFTLLQFWAIIGNAYKLAFWLVAHLVHNPTLMDQIRQEVLPGVVGETIDEDYLLEQCPMVESLFTEALRLTVSSSLARVIMEPTVVGGKLLKPGNKIMLPISELHSDVDVWGDAPGIIQPGRFIDNSKLSKSLSYRPWGGGHTLCAGRFFVRRAVNALVAILLSRYDIEPVSKVFPRADGARPSPGVILVEQGQDVQLRCTTRQ